MPEHTPEPMELPDPHPAFVLYRWHVEATLEVLGPKKAERYLRSMARKAELEEAMGPVVPMRPASAQGQLQLVVRQAANMVRRYMPTFLAKLPPR